MAEETRRTILCVDDEADVVDSLYDTFMDTYNVKTATSGEEALKIFKEEDICLVITDQRMPQMEGTEILARVKGMKPICKKILLTGYADITAAIDAINKGSVDRYFSKPWDDGELLQAVKDLLVLYKTDEFLEKVMDEARGMKDAANKGRSIQQVLERFMDSHPAGICVAGEEERVEYVNRKGLDIIGCGRLDEIRGRDVKEIFDINEISRRGFHEKYLKKDASPEKLALKPGGAGPGHVEASVTFTMGEKGVQVCGIVFNRK
ncbi:MAG: response regulator [Pseudomonadota bacterium]